MPRDGAKTKDLMRGTDRYRDFLEGAEGFATESWPQHCRTLLDAVMPVLQELDLEAGDDDDL